MDKVILFEQEEHYEVVAAYTTSFLKSGDIHVEIYCNPKVKTNLFPLFQNSVSWCTLSDSIHPDSKYDRTAIIITSPVQKFIPNLFDRFPVYILIHNIHHSFSPFSHIYFSNPKALVSKIKNWKSRKINQRMMEKSSGFLFISPDLNAYFNENFKSLHPHKRTISFPTFLPLVNHRNKNLNHKKVIIPGSYHSSRRNFTPLLKMLEMHTFPDIEFIFLGKLNPTMQSTLTLLQQTNPLIFYNKELTLQEFYTELVKGDLLILPLKKYKYFAGIKERTGLSTFSAIWMDAYSAGIPAFIPEYLHVEPEFTGFFQKYKDESDLAVKLKEYFKKDYLSLKINFQNQIKQYFNPLIKKAIHEILNNE